MVPHNKFALAEFENLLLIKSDACILWPYGNNGKGYGQVYVEGKHKYVHRLACESAHGPAPTGHLAAHSCRNRHCMNPRHLRWATPSQNTADMITDNTVLRGEKNPSGKLTEADVLEIRSATGTQTEIARRFGVSQPIVSRIRSKAIWSWL